MTASQKRSTEISTTAATLELDTLPKRLSNQQLATVIEIANAPIPAAEPASRDYLVKILRSLDASLPRKNADETSGALMVEIYYRMLREYSEAQLEWLAIEALKQCDWFPTVKQCKKIISQYQRSDKHTHRKYRAGQIAQKELDRRREKFIAQVKEGKIPQQTINKLPYDVVNHLRRNGVIRWNKAESHFEAVSTRDNMNG